jgi:hypothetical protein
MIMKSNLSSYFHFDLSSLFARLFEPLIIILDLFSELIKKNTQIFCFTKYKIE